MQEGELDSHWLHKETDGNWNRIEKLTESLGTFQVTELGDRFQTAALGEGSPAGMGRELENNALSVTDLRITRCFPY